MQSTKKKLQLMSSIDYSLIKSAVRLSVISDIDVNNGCVLLYAVVTHVLAVAYLALDLEETGAPNRSNVNKCTCKIIECDDVISFVDIRSSMVPIRLDGIHIGTPAWPLKFLNPILGKRFCKNTGPMRTGIVVLKNGTCSLMCS